MRYYYMIIMIVALLVVIESAEGRKKKKKIAKGECNCADVSCPKRIPIAECTERNGIYINASESNENCLCCDSCLVIRSENENCLPSLKCFVNIVCDTSLICNPNDNYICTSKKTIEKRNKQQKDAKKYKRIKSIECDCQERLCTNMNEDMCKERAGTFVEKLTDTEHCQCCDECRITRGVNQSCVPSKHESVIIKCANGLSCNSRSKYICEDRSVKQSKLKSSKLKSSKLKSSKLKSSNSKKFKSKSITSFLSGDQILDSLEILTPKAERSPEALGADDIDSDDDDDDENDKLEAKIEAAKTQIRSGKSKIKTNSKDFPKTLLGIL